MDKLLNAVKDLTAIKKYLEAINQTTDDFLYMFDIPNNRIQFFGNFENTFKAGDSGSGGMAFEDILSICHPADHSPMSAGFERIRNGAADSHDINFRMFNVRGETVWVNSRGKVLHDENGAPFVMIGRLSEEALRHLYNPITGLWNNVKFSDDLMRRLHTGKGWIMLIGLPSLDGLMLVHGRAFRDSLLCEVADHLEKIDLIEESYHIDNDCFAIIISECGPDDVEGIYQKISMAVNEKCCVYAGAVPVNNSIFSGVSQLLDSASLTLKNAELSSTGRIDFFSADQINQKIGELTLLAELKESVQNGFEGFELHYQPQLKSGHYEISGVEALLRYNSKKRGRVFPDVFIPLLEQSGLIDPVGMWVLDTALAQCKVWRESIPELKVSVNFSPVQFDDIRLGDKIIDALKRVGLPGSALTVELTESVQLSDNKRYYDTVKYIKSYGVRFSIDDFGMGYSNLGYLKQLDVNEIKIDRSFVSSVEKDTYNYRLISNVIEFAKTNSIHACCEGVETARELSVLEPLQADYFQGYLFDKPCTAEQIAKKYIYSSSDEYKARMQSLDEISRFKEQFGSIHFDPRNILHENNVGLWIMRIDEKNNRYELHADEVMEQVMGLDESLSAGECYQYWYSRVSNGDKKRVSDALRTMINGTKAVQLEYRWKHPAAGEVYVRSSGIRTQDMNDSVMLEGYHKILTGVEEA